MKLIYPLLLFALFGLLPKTSQALTLPPNFSQVLVSSGLSNATAFAFAPDGRIFVCLQGGQLRVIKNGALLATPFVSLSVNSSGERGLLGIAFDPNFASNQYLYLYYTKSTSPLNNRISRFTANGDVAVAGSELILLDLDPLSSATNHNGGTMQFGTDGKLYVGIGENATPSYAQSLTTYHGKILRLNTDGTAAPGNPFITNPNAKTQRIWAYGVRNPYTLAIQPNTGRVFVNDVGQSTYEEINDATLGGRNFGWPSAEGPGTNSAFTNPVYFYGRTNACAITGGTFFNPTSTNYPDSLIGRYFFLDYCGDWIDMLKLTPTPVTARRFGSDMAASPVNMATGPDGNLYFLSRASSGLYKVVYSPPTPTTPPTITQQPQSQNQPVGGTATFSVTATGPAPLFYQWRKGANNIAGAIQANYTITNLVPQNAGTYSVVVSYGPGTPSVTSRYVTLGVTTAANTKPNANIIQPTISTTYGGGQIINYSGSGTDPQSGNLPSSALAWYINFHHDDHNHPAMPLTPGASGSFVVPDRGETATNVFYRFYLIASDPQGLKDTTFVDVQPRLSNVTLQTNPTGLEVTLDGQPFTAPYTFTGVEGIIREIGTPSPQSGLSFATWSDGGNATHEISIPAANSSFTATFTTGNIQTLNPIADAYVHSGGNANTNFGNAATLVTKKTNDVAWQRETLLRFDISGFSGSPGSAILRLYGGLSDNNNASLQVEVHEVPTNTWTETGVTWNNRPAHSNPILATQTIAGTTKTYYEWNLSSYVQQQKSLGNNTLNLKLLNTANSASRIDFNSRQAPTSQPQLVLSSGGAGRIALDNRMTNDATHTPAFRFYPNPVHGVLHLDLMETMQDGYVNVLDITGKTIYLLPIEATGLYDLDITGLKPGMYFLHLQSQQQKSIHRITVE